MLIEEGFVVAKRGSGYVVALNEGSLALSADLFSGQSERKPEDGEVHPPIRYDFTYRNQEPGFFPFPLWRRLSAEVLVEQNTVQASEYSATAGELPLRRTLARILHAMRGISCTPEQIIVQNGTRESLAGVLALFDARTTIVAMENPGYDAVRDVFVQAGFSLVACRSFEDDDAFLEDVFSSNARLVYVTPSAQFPTGRFMSLETRKKLLNWAHNNDAYILEDDFCWEFCYEKNQTPSLFALDKGRRVVYMGTFSKSISPALRVSYGVFPEKLAAQWNLLFKNAYPAVSWMTQTVLSQYLSDSSARRNLRRLQVRCREKHRLLVSALHETMGDRIRIIDHGTGLHVLIKVLDGRSEDELIESALTHGVRIYGTRRYWMNPSQTDEGCVLVGHSALFAEDIASGVQALAKAWFA